MSWPTTHLNKTSKETINNDESLKVISPLNSWTSLHDWESQNKTVTRQLLISTDQRRAINHESPFKRGKFLTISPTNKNKQKGKCFRLYRPFPVAVRGSSLSCWTSQHGYSWITVRRWRAVVGHFKFTVTWCRAGITVVSCVGVECLRNLGVWGQAHQKDVGFGLHVVSGKVPSQTLTQCSLVYLWRMTA